MVQTNPFLIEGYLSPDYFCDRVEETSLLTRHITNRCNVALIAPRRLGKSGLIYHCFQQKEICEQYHCVYIDIYESKDYTLVQCTGNLLLAGLHTMTISMDGLGDEHNWMRGNGMHLRDNDGKLIMCPLHRITRPASISK